MKQLSPTERAAPLARYVELVRRYHSTLDLMSDDGLARIDEYVQEAVAYAELIASLEPAPGRLMDVGSGAGLPGVVVAATLPELEIELVERRRKRATFLRMALVAVGRGDARVIEGDVRVSEGPEVDVVTAQAVGTFSEVYALVRHRCSAGVVLLARKGPDWQQEVARLEAEVAPRSSVGPSGRAEMPSATAVLADRPLGRRGTLVAVRVHG